MASGGRVKRTVRRYDFDRRHAREVGVGVAVAAVVVVALAVFLATFGAREAWSCVDAEGNFAQNDVVRDSTPMFNVALLAGLVGLILAIVALARREWGDLWPLGVLVMLASGVPFLLFVLFVSVGPYYTCTSS